MTNSFDSANFLEIAQNLIDDENYHEEGRLRTCIGRAYYAAFLEALQRLEAAGFKIKNVGEIHKDVIERIYEEGFTQTSNKLERLRRLRIIADYKLKEDISYPQCKSSINLSEVIIKEIKTFF